MKISRISSLIKTQINVVSKHSLSGNNHAYSCEKTYISKITNSKTNVEKIIIKLQNKPKYLNADCAKLTEILSKQVLNYDEIIDLLTKYPKANGRIGCLPNEWTNHIPNQNFNNQLKLLQEGFGDIACSLRDNNKSENVEKASLSLNNLCHSIGILPKERKIAIEKFSEGGFWGVGYLIKNDANEAFVMKVFYCTREFNDNYGNLLEANKAQYWSHNAGKDNQFPNFYYADLNNGFLIDQYISDFAKPPKKTVNPESIGLKYCDLEGNNNQKFGYIYDYGCLAVNLDDIVRNSNIRRIYTQIYNTPEANRSKLIKSLIEENNNKNYSEDMLSLNEALKFFPENIDYLLKLKIKMKILVSKFAKSEKN